MSIRYSSIVLGLLIFGLLSCSKSMEETSIGDPPIVDEMETEDPEGSEDYLNENAAFLFNDDSLYSYYITIDEAAYARLDSDPAAEIYEEASLTFRGETISPIGMRYKGSIGAFVGCLSGSDWGNPSGSKTCTKLSIKLKINWEGREERFYDQKKIQLHSMNQDDSHMRERLGYHLFREMGIATPRATHARLFVNGEYVGIFAMIEQIDSRFTRANWDDGKGNLYKEIWPLNDQGQAQSANTYLAALKTNENDNPSAEIMQSFASELENSQSINDIQSVIEDRMDLDNIISYAAVDRTIRHDDGPFHWYCGGNACENHNFYWYEEPNNRKLHLIPWDLDHAFQNIIFPNNFVTNIPDGWGETRNNCEPFGVFITQRSAACDKLTAGWVSYEDLFEDKKSSFINGPLSASAVDALLTKWSDQISNSVNEADGLYGDAISLGQMNEAIQELRDQLAFARSN